MDEKRRERVELRQGAGSFPITHGETDPCRIMTHDDKFSFSVAVSFSFLSFGKGSQACPYMRPPKKRVFFFLKISKKN